MITGGYLVLFLDEIINRAGFWSQTDILVACIATVTVLEASRRAVGFSMTVIGLIAIAYAMAGPRGDLAWLGSGCRGFLNTAATASTALPGSCISARKAFSGCR